MIKLSLIGSSKVGNLMLNDLSKEGCGGSYKEKALWFTPTFCLTQQEMVVVLLAQETYFTMSLLLTVFLISRRVCWYLAYSVASYCNW